MVDVDTIWGIHTYKSYVEARKSAYSELTGAYQSAYGQIHIYPNSHSNKAKEIMEYFPKTRQVVCYRVEKNAVAMYEVKKNGELGSRLNR